MNQKFSHHLLSTVRIGFIAILFSSYTYSALFAQASNASELTFQVGLSEHEEGVILYSNNSWRFMTQLETDTTKGTFNGTLYPNEPYQIGKTESGIPFVIYPNSTWRYLELEKSESNTASNSNSQGNINSHGNTNTKTSVQCSGTTQKGLRCQRMTLSLNGRCYQHGGN